MSISRRMQAAALCVAAAASTPALAQSFNLDCGSGFGTSSNSYGAAAGQPGFWQEIPNVNAGVPVVLNDLAGLPTGVSLTSAATLFNVFFNNAGTSGDDQALLDDALDLNVALATFTFNGLANGDYTVYTYAWAPDDETFRTSVDVVGAPEGPQLVGGPWPGALLAPLTHAVHSVQVTDGTVVIKASESVGFSTLNGIQIVKAPLGGCCLPGNVCSNDLQLDCENQGGTFLGVEMQCETLADCNSNGLTDVCETFAGGDFDADGSVGLTDLAAFGDCLAGPGQPPNPANPACADACLNSFDFNGDGDVDLADFAGFALAFTGP
jgi:hypothetical protein